MYSGGDPKIGGATAPQQACKMIEGNTLRQIADQLGIPHADIQKSNFVLNEQYGLDGVLPKGEEVSLGKKFNCPGIFKGLNGSEAYANIVTVGKSGVGTLAETTIPDLSALIADAGGIDE